ncbi:interleukin-17 receptor E isoform X2 [Brachyhypopomus gauderio]|uniref:interleukin-17 receptor E isoform X2 n=1 Tax=Brachyhypopomus gauderio TaxID=698409 RepID=UPI0040416184
MCGLYAFAGLVLSLRLTQLSVASDSTHKNVLKIKQHWVDSEKKQNLPQLKLFTVQANKTDMCVRVRVRMKPPSHNKTVQIEFTELASNNSQNIFVKEGHHENETVWWEELFKDRRKVEVRCSFRPGGRHTRVWHLTFDCFKAQAGNRVYVSVRELNQTLITASPTVIHPQVRVFPVPRFPVNHRSGSDEGKDTVPVYNLKVDILAKRFLVTMAEGQNVKVRLCFKNFQRECSGARPHQVNTDLNRTISLNFTHLVPCMCVQLYYFSLDAKRDTACPLKDKTLPGGGDVLSSSSLIPFGSSVLQWKPLCPSAQSKPSVALCWQQPENQSHCVHVQNSTLVETELSYNVSQVDKHPHMCVKFSLNESRRVFCPYSSGLIPKWEVTVVLGPQGLRVQLSSSVQAVFAAQLCVRENEACVAIGNVHSVLMKQDARHGELSIPLSSSSSGLCVQVWQAVPALLGRRTICPDYSHRRWGLILAVSLAFLVTVTTLGILTYNMIKKKTSVWRRSERKPVLLVCSSDDVAHVAAVCALASGLQEELCVDVRLAHWTHCSTQASLARLGPVPWLYGQCQAVQQAGGVVLVAWSADALRAFLRWREGQVEEMEHRWSGKETWTERAREASSVVAPVFIAALASLWTGLHSERRGEGFGLIDFRGLGGSCYVPKDLRGVRRYCLPRDLSSLVHELDLKARGPGGVKAAVSQWCCWPRLISKVLSSWLSQRLAQRLEACLPQADERARLASERTLPLKSDSGKNTKLKQKIRLLTDDPDSMEYNETSEKEQLGMPA